MGVLAPALRGHRRNRALEDLQQRLLHALAGDVTGDRGVLGLAADLVHLVDVDDAALGLLHVVVRSLQQLQQDVLDVLADVPGLGQRGRVRHREGDVEHLREGLGEIGLAAAGGADEHHVGLRDLDVLVVGAGLLGEGLGGALRGRAGLLGVLGAHALVVVVDGDGERALGGLLSHHVLLEEVEDLPRRGQRGLLLGGGLRGLDLLGDDLVAQLDALLADVHPGPGDQALDLLLRLAAEGALEDVTGLARTCHSCPPPRRSDPTSLPGASRGAAQAR